MNNDYPLDTSENWDIAPRHLYLYRYQNTGYITHIITTHVIPSFAHTPDCVLVTLGQADKLLLMLSLPDLSSKTSSQDLVDALCLDFQELLEQQYFRADNVI